MWPNREDDEAMYNLKVYDMWAKRMKCSDCPHCETWRADGKEDGPVAAWCMWHMEEVISPALEETIYEKCCEPDGIPTEEFEREWNESARLELADRAYADAREVALWAS